jgi:hypothetical protein
LTGDENDDGLSSHETNKIDIDDDDEEEEEKVEEKVDLPVTVTMTTALGNSLMDLSIEIDAKRSRTVGFLKERLRKLLPGKPPVSSIHLVLDGKRLADEVSISDILEEEEEENQEKETTASIGLSLVIDMIPPVDPRFVTLIEEQLSDMTTSDLLQAFVINEASLLKNAFLLENDFKRASSLAEEDIGSVDGEEICDSVAKGESLDAMGDSPDFSGRILYLDLRDEAARIRGDLEQTILGTPKARELLSDSKPPSQQRLELEIRGHRVRIPRKGGRMALIKEGIQRNLNVNWGDTIRYCILFIFFGYFGGRTPASRAILLLGAPSVFVLQARPVKLLIKQLLYAICDHPPGILLSLLPAPQQGILNLDYGESMRLLYASFSEVAGGREKSTDFDDDGDSSSEEDD